MRKRVEAKSSLTLHPNTILVPVDFSSTSTKAFRKASRLAGEAGQVVLLYVAPLRARGVAGLLEAASNSLYFFSQQTPAENRCAITRIVCFGPRASTILRVAGERNAGLIVMPVHGAIRTDAVAKQVVRNAHCAVLLVRDQTISEHLWPNLAADSDPLRRGLERVKNVAVPTERQSTAGFSPLLSTAGNHR
jgi:nucleotide-binding universal stress UspA family protein